jgi:hypothetical protein
MIGRLLLSLHVFNVNHLVCLDPETTSAHRHLQRSNLAKGGVAYWRIGFDD